jgi:ribonuclease HI
VKVWTDGSCIPNPGNGGWAVVFADGAEYYGAESNTTSNRMELTAIQVAIRKHIYSDPLTIYTDSLYSLKLITAIYKAKHNQDLIHSIQQRIKNAAYPITILWIRAHNGQTQNERADKLAKQCALGQLTPIGSI